MMMGATTKTTEPKLVAVDTKDIIKLIKKNKNYTSDYFQSKSGTKFTMLLKATLQLSVY
jgi:hypothetical protein